MASQAQTGVIAVQDKVFPVTFSVTASAATNTTFTGTIYPFGLNNPNSGTSFQVPASSNYQLVDLYNSSTPTPDYQLIFNLNGIQQGENLIGSTLTATNSARARISQPLVLKASDVLTVQIITTAANALTTAVSLTLYLHFLQVPA